MKYLILTSLLLTSCETRRVNKTIYQPEVLIIDKGTIVHTIDGIFISPEKQVWFSKKRVMELEEKLSQF
jgi:hypothetical protein